VAATRAPWIPSVAEPGAWSRFAGPDALPGLATQPTAAGKRVVDLALYDERLYVAYGDQSANTGPIVPAYVDLASGAIGADPALPTEELRWFERFAGALYVSVADPRGHEAEGSFFRLSSPCASWEVLPAAPGAVHVYRSAQHGDRLWVGSGSVEDAPAEVFSIGGEGDLRVEHLRESPAGGFSRFYYVGSDGRRLVATGRSYADAGELSFAEQLEDGVWSEVSGVPDAHALVPIGLAGALHVLALAAEPGRGGGVAQAYRLEAGALVPEPFLEGRLLNFARVVDPTGTSLHALVDEGGVITLRRTWDLVAWETLANLPSLDGDAPSALAVTHAGLFVGTVSGSLWRLGP
jgi:hypothetical protein